MSSTKTESTQSREMIQRLAETMNSAQAGYEVWYTLAGKDKGYEEYSAVLQDYRFRDFFDSVLNAHFKVMYIDIACLFEPHERTSSFYGLKNLLKDDGYHDAADRIECAISLHKDLIERIKGNRDKSIAHHVTKWSEDKLRSKYGVTPNAISSLLKTFNELLRMIYKDVVSPNTAYPIARTDRFEEATFRLLQILMVARGESEKMTTQSG